MSSTNQEPSCTCDLCKAALSRLETAEENPMVSLRPDEPPSVPHRKNTGRLIPRL
jgi:hypothetical protein